MFQGQKTSRPMQSERKEMKNSNIMRTLLNTALILLLVGCATLTNSGVTSNGSTSLVTRPDFEAARAAAPAWVRAALDENSNLRAEVKELKLSK